MKVGILGAGRIAEKMAMTLNQMQTASAYAIASRDLQRAAQFAEKWNMEKAYGSYEEMLDDPQVELVYIATPHSHHYEHARMCLLKGKPVLCEKTFTANAAQAKALIELARAKNVFLAEAIWTRYLPFSQTITDLINNGVIGTPHMLTANLGYPVVYKERITRLDLCGGSLLDLGIYPINFARMIFGTDIAKVTSTCLKGETGVDLQNSITFTYADGKMAVMQTTVLCANDRQGIISGDNGYLIIDNINNPQEAVAYNKDHAEVARYHCLEQITGFEYQVEACMQAIRNGEIESPYMPHEETLKVMELLDALRKEWGIEYPADNCTF